MSLQIIDCEQGTDEWLKARLGCVSATGFKNVCNAKTGRGKYMAQLGAERNTGVPTEHKITPAMARGTELEPEARMAYEAYKCVKVHQIGFMKSQDWVGCSPDGLIAEDGVLELKCPLASTHYGYLVDKKLPSQYRLQVQGLLWVSGRKYCDFVSYHPEFKHNKLFILRVEPDLKIHTKLAVETEKFLAELEEMQKNIPSCPF